MTHLVADTERLRRLQLLGDAALSSLELDELLSALLERIGGLLDADTCMVLLLNDERTELVAGAALGIEEEVEQVHPRRSRRRPGLGLSIARTYARAHDGDLFFLAGPGGARFELVIPQR